MKSAEYRSKVGPEALAPEARRERCVSARFSDKELERLDELCGKQGLKRGEYLRMAAFSALPPQVPEINRQAWAELSRAASNLNQVARAVNTEEDLDIEKIRQVLKEFRAKLIRASEV